MFSDDQFDLLKRAIQSVERDNGFKLPSVPASTALTTATKMIEWMGCQENESAAYAFSRKLGECLKGGLPQSTASLKSQREEMWRNFHTLRVSESFKKLWHEFLKSAGLEVNPLFYQYVSDVIYFTRAHHEAVHSLTSRGANHLTLDI